jgi:hypothetical protein
LLSRAFNQWVLDAPPKLNKAQSDWLGPMTISDRGATAVFV